MAKNQNLALNPSKVSGGCGRLLCCLTYENEAYTDLRKRLPPKGTKVRVLDSSEIGEVVKSDLLNQLVEVSFEDGRQETYPIKETKIVEKSRFKEPDAEVEGDDWGEDLDIAELENYVDEIEDKKVQSKNAPQKHGHKSQRPGGKGKQHPKGSRNRQGNQRRGQNKQDSGGQKSASSSEGRDQDRGGRSPNQRGRRNRKKPNPRNNKPNKDESSS